MSHRAKGISCKTILCVFIFSGIILFSGTHLQAKSGKATFGIHAGPIFSNHWSTGETPEGYDLPSIQTGITLSGYCNFKLSNRFSLQGEIGYAEKGAKHTLEIVGFPFGPVDVTYSTEHIEVPVWVKFYVIKKEKFRLYTGAGGYYAHLTGGEYLL